MFSDTDGVSRQRGTGVSIAPQVFLTALCAEAPAATARVYFNPLAGSSTGYPYTNGTTGTLASEGALVGLAMHRGRQVVSFDVVGDGLQDVKPELRQECERRRGTARVITDGYYMQLSNIPATGAAGRLRRFRRTQLPAQHRYRLPSSP